MDIYGDELWLLLLRLEPRLKAVFEIAKLVVDDESKNWFCANSVWYGYGQERPRNGLKQQMSRLVGWNSENGDDPILGSSEAYDIATNKIYEELPSCRNCACL